MSVVLSLAEDGLEPHLSVIVSAEDGRWHLSISHRVRGLDGTLIPGRNPTWEEISEARYQFCPNDITMVMFLPPREQYVNLHDTTFHLYQIGDHQ